MLYLESIPPCPVNPPDLSPIALEYWEATRRIDPVVKQALEQKAAAVSKETLDSFVYEIHFGREFSHFPQYPHCAWLALQKGLISREQFTTIMLYWVTTEQNWQKPKDLKRIPLFNDKEINIEAVELILKSALKTHLISRSFTKLQKASLEQVFQMFQYMSSAPHSEKYILHYQACEEELKEKTNANIACRLGENFLFYYSQEQQIHRLVPSATLQQVALNVLFGEGAVKMNFVVELSSSVDIELGACVGWRDSLVPFPGFLQENADGYKTKGPDFHQHDNDHATLAGLEKVEHQNGFARASLIVRQMNGNPGMLAKISSKFLDGSNLYRKDIADKDPLFKREMFLLSLVQKINNVQINHKQYINIFKAIISDYFENQAEWDTLFSMNWSLISTKRFKEILEKSGESTTKLYLTELVSIWDHFKSMSILIKAFKKSQTSEFSHPLLNNFLENISSFSYFYDKEFLLFVLNKKGSTEVIHDFSNCSVLDDEVLEEVLKIINQRNEQVLDLSFCKKLTPKSLEKLKSSIINHLKIDGCDQLVKHLDLLPDHIEKISIVKCPSLRFADLMKLETGRLQELRIDLRLSDEEIKAIQTKFKLLQIHFVR